jgi:CheY-like chemotaxis protein
MPGLDGVEACRMLKSAAPEMPIIVASGLIQDHTVQKVLSEGASGFLAKPFAIADLIQAVSAALVQQRNSSPIS